MVARFRLVKGPNPLRGATAALAWYPQLQAHQSPTAVAVAVALASLVTPQTLGLAGLAVAVVDMVQTARQSQERPTLVVAAVALVRQRVAVHLLVAQQAVQAL